MDPVSQGALGAGLAAGSADRRRVGAAVLLGGLSGMAPDLDVFIRSAEDPLLFLEYHRQFTHALVFIPVGALICALVLHPLVGRRLRFVESFWFCLLGYATHGLLDACTSYGTQLLWPFSDARIAWNAVSVVDPLFTLPVAILVVLATRRGRPSLAGLAMLWAVTYIGFGLVQHQRAEAVAVAVARERGHAPERLTVKPSFGNVLVWKSIYAAEGRYHVDALRMGRRVQVFPGDSIAVLDTEQDLPWLRASSRQAADIERFRWFSDDYLGLDRRDGLRVVDVRYSMVPDEIDALWGLLLDPEAAPHRPVAFFHNSRPTPEQRAALWRMLVGLGVTRLHSE